MSYPHNLSNNTQKRPLIAKSRDLKRYSPGPQQDGGASGLAKSDEKVYYNQLLMQCSSSKLAPLRQHGANRQIVLVGRANTRLWHVS